jgi:hypothetical protein
MIISTNKINERMTLQLNETHHGSKSWHINILDEATGLSIMVGDPNYWTKRKAEDAFASTGQLLRHMVFK